MIYQDSYGKDMATWIEASTILEISDYRLQRTLASLLLRKVMTQILGQLKSQQQDNMFETQLKVSW